MTGSEVAIVVLALVVVVLAFVVAALARGRVVRLPEERWRAPVRRPSPRTVVQAAPTRPSPRVPRVNQYGELEP